MTLFSFSFITLPTSNLFLVLVNISLVGFFLLPIIPLGYGFSIELTYPVSEAMSNGVLMLFSQILGSTVTFLASYLCSLGKVIDEETGEKDSTGSKYCLLLFFGMMLTASLASLFVKEDLRRIKITESAKLSKISGFSTLVTDESGLKS